MYLMSRWQLDRKCEWTADYSTCLSSVSAAWLAAAPGVAAVLASIIIIIIIIIIIKDIYIAQDR